VSPRLTMPRGVFARLAFVKVAQADLDAGHYEWPPKPALSPEEASALAAEVQRANADLDAMGATGEQWVAVGEWLGGPL